MKKKTTDKFHCWKGHFFEFIVMLTISIGEGNFAVIYGLDSMVWYGYTMRTAAEIFENLLEPCEGFLGINDSGLFFCLLQ